GAATVMARYTEDGCEYSDSQTIQIFAVPTADFTVSSPVCLNGASTVTYTGSATSNADFTWDYDSGSASAGPDANSQLVNWATPGDKTISLTVTENGCASEVFSTTVEVQDSLQAPIIGCDGDNTSITFTWNDVVGATSYNVTVIDVPADAMAMADVDNRTYSFTNLTPGASVTIQVEALTNSECGSVLTTQTCTAQNCDPRAFGTDTYGPFCADEAAQTFAPLLSGGSLVGMFTWAGAGITDPATGAFDPAMAAAGDNAIMLSYEEAGCIYDTTYTVVVNPVPTAEFTASGPICQTATSTLEYSGMASSTAIYTWTFGIGIVESGSGAGPYEISWPESGEQTVTLTVTENNCVSAPFAQTVNVQEALQAPIISCTGDNTSITFTWNEVVGATGYTVNVLDAPAGAVETEDIANRTYSFTNLTPGDEVEIEITTLSNGVCENVTTTQTCTAQSCDDRGFDEATFGPFCADAAAQQLTADIAGNTDLGTFTWGGPGITDPATGAFDPSMAALGDNNITLNYAENGCFYDTVYVVTVNAVPVADIMVTDTICANSTATVTFTGTAGMMASYDWDFGTGTVESGSGAGPYEVSWPTAEAHTVTLVVTENGCVSNTATATVEVQPEIAPVEVVCQTTTTNSVTFAWDPVANADTYTVVVTDGPMGTQDGNTYTIVGLTDGQSVTIEVTAAGTTICGNSVATGTCIAQACQPVQIDLLGSEADICAGTAVELMFAYSGGSGAPLTVDYTVNGAAFQSTGVTDGTPLDLGAINANTVVEITQVTDESNSNCIYTPTVSWSVAVDEPVSAGVGSAAAPFCASLGGIVTLGDLITDGDTGGVWSETTANSSGNLTPNGTFDPVGLAAGTYTFAYTVAGSACPDEVADVSVTILPDPTADAGLDQELTCTMGAVTLGGNSSVGTYAWSSDNPDAMIMDPNAELIDVSAPGSYTLTVTTEEGCTASDEVAVISDIGVPVGDVSISDVSCFQDADGAIVINNVTGGQQPYSYSLNGGPATTNPFFGGLGSDMYSLLITDAEGCFTELAIELIEPTEVAVTLTTIFGDDGAQIDLGSPITLTAQYDSSIEIDTIIWRPDSIAALNQGSVTVMPDQSTVYSVTITDINGCSDSDNLTVFVNKERPVFIPSAFNPNGASGNDFFYPQGGDVVQNIKSMLIFNRWGEPIYEKYDFAPGIPEEGWDGTYRGQPLNAAVFVYYLEVEFSDGEVVLFKGDVLLIK
ncbi:MAG: gliding motility-associated C-terminal domain-containing protein, partial [Bacteroidota bacterium]